MPKSTTKENQKKFLSPSYIDFNNKTRSTIDHAFALRGHVTSFL